MQVCSVLFFVFSLKPPLKVDSVKALASLTHPPPRNWAQLSGLGLQEEDSGLMSVQGYAAISVHRNANKTN